MKTRYIILNGDVQKIVHTYDPDTGASQGVLVFDSYDKANYYSASRFNNWDIIKQEFKPLGLRKEWLSTKLM